jgi:hypothetical protein
MQAAPRTEKVGGAKSAFEKVEADLPAMAEAELALRVPHGTRAEQHLGHHQPDFRRY